MNRKRKLQANHDYLGVGKRRANVNEAELLGRIREFSRIWRQVSKTPDLSERLVHLLGKLATFELRPNGHVEVLRPSPRLEIASGIRMVKALALAVDRMRAVNALPNPWRAAGLKEDEVRNSSVLALLWDAHRSGPPARAFLREFLGRVSPRSNPLPISDLLDGEYHVRLEDSPLGLDSERIDITIESSKVLLGIEVKINAGLGKEQLERYVQTVRRRATLNGQWYRVIFLAPFASPSDEVISATWGDVVAASRVTLSLADEITFTHHLIERYAAHILQWRK